MKILVINCGSSSIKYQLISIDGKYDLLAKGLIQRIGESGASISHTASGKDKVVLSMAIPDHEAAMMAMTEALTNAEYGVISSTDEIDGVGHRVVHGGEKFKASTLINDDVLKAIEENSTLAPLHNPPNITGIEVCRKLMPDTPNVAVFDTAIHQTMPKYAYLYALPMELYEKHGVRKYGFHGTSHGYVAKKAAKIMDKPFDELKIVTCHLGNGGSLAAFDCGKVVETSMGLTPLEGVVMGSRCGDLDPAIVLYMMETLNLSLQETNDLLNKKSGLLGICGMNDMRDIKTEADKGNENAKLAIDMFCFRVIKYIGAYASVMNGVDGIVFTAGIGENSHWLREKVLDKFKYLGAAVDRERNENNETVITTNDSKVVGLMIHTNEELVIAQDTYQLVK